MFSLHTHIHIGAQEEAGMERRRRNHLQSVGIFGRECERLARREGERKRSAWKVQWKSYGILRKWFQAIDFFRDIEIKEINYEKYYVLRLF